MGTQIGLRGSDGGPAAPPYTLLNYEWDSNMDYQRNLKTSGTFTEGIGRFYLSETFNRLPQINASVGIAANHDFEILGTNISDDDVTFATTIGGIQCQTDGGSGDQVIILPHLDTIQTAWTGVLWGTENRTIWECQIRTDAITDVTIWAGLKLTNTSVIATDADQAFFRFEAATDTNWRAISSIGGTDTDSDTGIAVAANTNLHFRIEIDSARKASFFINGTQVGTVTAALTDDVNFIPYIGVEADAAATKILNVAWQKISRIVFE